MANLQSAFSQFHRMIALTSGNKKVLRMALEVNRNKIRTYFRNTFHQQVPRFRSQGSYAANTVVNPINGEINLNDGVYLQHLDGRDDSKWPTGADAQQLINNAVSGNRRAKTIEQCACVRLQYKGLCHIDFSIYGLLKGQSLLAVNGEPGWAYSDPYALTRWFKSYFSLYGEQLRRIIQYIKAWADFQSRQFGEMPNSLVLSVLATRYFQDDIRDDVAMSYTFQVMSKAVTTYFSVPNPVNINEELSERLSEAQKKHFCEAVQAAVAYSISAIREKDTREASVIWQKVFGNRFPLLPDR